LKFEGYFNPNPSILSYAICPIHNKLIDIKIGIVEINAINNRITGKEKV
jgi:hypothetical protein